MDNQRQTVGPPEYELVVVGVTLTRLGYHAVLRWLELIAKEPPREIPRASER